MTIGSAPSSASLLTPEIPPAQSAPFGPPVPATKAIPAGPPTGRISDAWLTRWILERRNLSCAATIGSETAVPSDDAPRRPDLAIHLNRPLPLPPLLRAMHALQGRNAADAVLIMAEARGDETYREHLHIDHEQQVLGIRRRFRKHGEHKGRARVVGIVWRTDGTFRHTQSPIAGAGCWRTIRAIFKTARGDVARQTVLSSEMAADFRGDLLAHLPPNELRALAAELNYRAVRNFCFAHPEARIADAALLSGPLFIDAHAIIGAEQIHLGPGWVGRDSPSFTLPARRDGNAAAATPPHPHAQQQVSGGEYFIGPAARHRPGYERVKRAFDLLIALAALAVTLPICLAVAAIIKLYDRGPIFFIHRREGRNGRPFGCIKFRTMVRHAESLKAQLRQSSQVDGPQFKMANDPRITPIGRFLRKSNIDELPQFLNVLRGHMSVVGPRPSPFEENQLCPGWREARLSVKPGITGLWQISRSRHRGAADFQEWIFFDTQYVERRSLWLDLRILLLTIKELFGKGQ